MTNEFLSGMLVGTPLGFASGFPAGIAAGEKRSRREIALQIRKYAELHTVEIRDGLGRPVPVEEFIDSVIAENTVASDRAIITVIVGVLFLLLTSVVVLFNLV